MTGAGGRASSKLTIASLATSTVLMAFGASSASGANPVAFDSVAGACADIESPYDGYEDGVDSTETSVQPGNHRPILGRATFSGGAGYWAFNEGSVDSSFDGSDTDWEVDYWGVDAGDQIDVDLWCDTPFVSYAVEFFDVPDAPTSFSGETTPPGSSTVAFRAPTAGRYQANVVVTSGVISVDEGTPISGSRTISLGDLRRQEQSEIVVRPSGLQQASWSIAVSEFEDVIGPTVRITNAPPKRSSKRRARVSFSSNETVDFECKLDVAGWASCGSPYRTGRLSIGTHRFSVRARDAVRNLGNTETIQFRVVKKKKRR